MAHCLQRDKDKIVSKFSLFMQKEYSVIFRMLGKSCQSRILQPAKEKDKQPYPKVNRRKKLKKIKAETSEIENRKIPGKQKPNQKLVL